MGLEFNGVCYADRASAWAVAKSQYNALYVPNGPVMFIELERDHATAANCKQFSYQQTVGAPWSPNYHTLCFASCDDLQPLPESIGALQGLVVQDVLFAIGIVICGLFGIATGVRLV